MPLNVCCHWNRVDLLKEKRNHDALIIINGSEELSKDISIAIQLVITPEERGTLHSDELVNAMKELLTLLRNNGVIDIIEPNYKEVGNRLRIHIAGTVNRINTLKCMLNNNDIILYHKVDFEKLEQSYLTRFGSAPYRHGNNGIRHDIKQAELLNNQSEFVIFDKFVDIINSNLNNYTSEVKSRLGHRQSNDRKLIIEALKLKIDDLKRQTNQSNDVKVADLVSFIKGCTIKTYASHTKGIFGFIGVLFTKSNLNIALNNALATLPITQLDVNSVPPNEQEVDNYLKKKSSTKADEAKPIDIKNNYFY